MQQNVSKKCKNTSTKQESVSDAAFKAWPFSSDFNFVFKDGQVTAAKCKYYCPLVVSPTITNCFKEFHLKCRRVPRSISEIWKRCRAQKLVRFHVKTSLFLYYFKMLPLLSKVIVFFSVTFYSIYSIFDKPFRQFLPLSYFYGSGQWFFKVKISCRRVNFLKK